ncbi:MAG: ATP-binding cassette domain-containing protein [Pseudomonadota bacterium]|nr:ATP-binding cassette domain-containing protein [Pseudomonadota bacterium]
MTTALLQLENVVRHYRLPRTHLFRTPPVIRAVDGVSLSVAPGETLGVVGESGSGKSTLARLAMALERPDAGRVRFNGEDLAALSADDLRTRRRQFQMVFQDPFGSLDPRMTVRRIVAEPLRSTTDIAQADYADRIAEAITAVGLRPADLEKYPHEFSGGQRQRIAIARAVVTRPALLVADEPVSALDVSVQAQILNLFMDLQDRYGLACLFISHDLGVVASLCDRVAVMRQGGIVESGTVRQIFTAPSHDYTRALLAAVPRRTV